jgi:penicillin-insensitive murein endopeptidase
MSPGSHVVLATLVLALSLGASNALATTQSSRARAARDAVSARASSMGSPNEGRLQGGERLESSGTVRTVGGHRWGMPSLVRMLERSAERVDARFPGSKLTVGDLSKKGGGDVDGHRSHESGRDADVGFYLLRGKKPFLAKRFATIDPDGRVRGLPAVRFDDARNWALVESWLKDEANVLQIFVAQHIKTRLLAQGRRSGASTTLLARASSVIIQPTKGLPHDNHFHVRVSCPRGQKACVNYGTRERKPARKSAPRARTSAVKASDAPRRTRQ